MKAYSFNNIRLTMLLLRSPSKIAAKRFVTSWLSVAERPIVLYRLNWYWSEERLLSLLWSYRDGFVRLDRVESKCFVLQIRTQMYREWKKYIFVKRTIQSPSRAMRATEGATQGFDNAQTPCVLNEKLSITYVKSQFPLIKNPLQFFGCPCLLNFKTEPWNNQLSCKSSIEIRVRNTWRWVLVCNREIE